MLPSAQSVLHVTIEGMSCSHCVAKVQRALQAVPGVSIKAVAVGSASVEIDTPDAAASVFAAIHAAGFSAHRSAPAPGKQGCCGCCSATT